MSNHAGNQEPEKYKRWYDNDPVLSRAIKQLREAPDKYQAQIALNIIKIIVEHQIETKTTLPVEELDSDFPYRRSWDEHRQCRRWYDVHEALASAIQLLGDCPDELQKRLIPTISAMIEKTLSEAPDK